MKNKWLWGISGLLALGLATNAPAQQSSSDSERAVLTLENVWLQSERVNNPDLITSIFSDKYIATGPDGKLEDKAQTQADAKGRRWTDTWVKMPGSKWLLVASHYSAVKP